MRNWPQKAFRLQFYCNITVLRSFRCNCVTPEPPLRRNFTALPVMCKSSSATLFSSISFYCRFCPASHGRISNIWRSAAYFPSCCGLVACMRLGLHFVLPICGEFSNSSILPRLLLVGLSSVSTDGRATAYVVYPHIRWMMDGMSAYSACACLTWFAHHRLHSFYSSRAAK